MNSKIIAILLGITVLLGGYYLVNQMNRNEATIDKLQEQVVSLNLDKEALLDEKEKLLETSELTLQEVQTLIAMNDTMSEALETLKDRLAAIEEGYETPGYPDEASVYILKEMGIEDYTVLSDSLMDLGQDIIGYEGILGGTMHFISVKVLNDKWAFARFEDGHYGGYGIYEFQVSDGRISWRTIVEYTDN